MGKEGWRVIAIVNTLAAKTLTNMVLNSIIRRQHLVGVIMFFHRSSIWLREIKVYR